MTEKEIIDWMNNNPIKAGAVLPFVATFGMMVILGTTMWLIELALSTGGAV